MDTSLGDVKSSDSLEYTQYFVMAILCFKILTLISKIISNVGKKKEWDSEKTWYNISKYLKTLSDISLAVLLILYFHPFSENIVLTGKVKTFIFTFSIAIIVNGFVSLFN